MPRKRTATESRFWPRIAKSDDCWLWLGGMRGEYGRIDGMSAHRFALAMRLGFPIPDGFDALHTCDIKRCVRNDDEGIYVVNGIARPRFGHLFLGTNGDNNRDRREKGRSAAGARNGAVVHRDRMPRGDANGMRLHPESVQRGESHKLARLTLEGVREIKRRYRDGGVTQPDLAREYGVSQASIWRILHGKAWPHA